MIYKLVSPIDYFQIEEKDIIEIGNDQTLYLTSPERGLIEYEFRHLQFARQIGRVNLNQLFDSCTMFRIGKFDELKAELGKDHLGHIMLNLVNYNRYTINALWFVKDNSCQLANSYLSVGSPKNVSIMRNSEFISNSSGACSTVIFT